MSFAVWCPVSRTQPLRNLTALLVLALTVAAGDAEDAAERRRLAAEIRTRVRAIESAHREQLAAREALDEESARVEAVITTLAARRDRLVEERDALRRRIGEGDAALAALATDAERDVALVRAWAAAARPVAERVGGGIGAGIPHRRAVRAGTFGEIAARLAPDGAPDALADGLRRFVAAAGQELQLAATREVRSETVVLGAGLAKHAYVARFGRVQEIFVTEDGTHAGIASHDAATPWIVYDDPARVARMITVLDCVRRRREPELLALPFALEANR